MFHVLLLQWCFLLGACYLYGLCAVCLASMYWCQRLESGGIMYDHMQCGCETFFCVIWHSHAFGCVNFSQNLNEEWNIGIKNFVMCRACLVHVKICVGCWDSPKEARVSVQNFVHPKMCRTYVDSCYVQRVPRYAERSEAPSRIIIF